MSTRNSTSQRNELTRTPSKLFVPGNRQASVFVLGPVTDEMMSHMRKIAHRLSLRIAAGAHAPHRKAAWYRRAWYLDDGPDGAAALAAKKKTQQKEHRP